MPRYLVERTFSTGDGTVALGDSPARSLEVIRTNAREGVTWIQSLVTPDRRRSFCIVDAPSPEAIRLAAQANTLPLDRITEVRVCDPYGV